MIQKLWTFAKGMPWWSWVLVGLALVCQTAQKMVIFYRLLKNGQMQGSRSPEE